MTDTLDDRAESNRQILREAFDAWQAGTARITDVFVRSAAPRSPRAAGPRPRRRGVPRHQDMSSLR